MSIPVHAAQPEPLDGCAQRSGQNWCNEEGGPETEPSADLEAEKSAEHVKAGVSKVEHAKHAEYYGEAAGHQEQQHAEQDAVQRGYDDEFKHDTPPREMDFARPGGRRGEAVLLPDAR